MPSVFSLLTALGRLAAPQGVPGPTNPSSYLPFVGGIDVEVTEDSLQAHFVIQLFIGGAIIRGPAGKRKAKIVLPEGGLCLMGSQALLRLYLCSQIIQSASKCFSEIKGPINFRRAISLINGLAYSLSWLAFAPGPSQDLLFCPLCRYAIRVTVGEGLSPELSPQVPPFLCMELGSQQQGLCQEGGQTVT